MVSAACAQDIEWNASAEEALRTGDGSALAAIWEELQAATSEEARGEFIAWRNARYVELNQETDASMLAALSSALWPVFTRAGEAAIQTALLDFRDSWTDLPIAEALEAEDYVRVLQLLEDAERNLDRETPQNATLSGRLQFYRARVFRDLGLMDRAFALKSELQRERLRLRKLVLENPAETPVAMLSQLTMLLAWLDLAERDYPKLISWLGEALEQEQLVDENRLEARYVYAIALFEVDRKDSTRTAEALAALSMLVDDLEASGDSDSGGDVPYQLLSQARLRWARIALHQGDTPTAATQIALAKEAAQALTEPSPKEEAHRLVFEVRLARRLGVDLEAKQEALLSEWERVLAVWREAPLRPGGLGYLTFDNHRRILAEVLRVQLELGSPENALRSLHDLGKVGTNSKVLESEGRVPKMPSLKVGELLLAYHVTAEETHLFAKSGDSLQHFALDLSEPELLEQLRALNTSLRNLTAASAAVGDRDTNLQQQSNRTGQLLLPDPVLDLLRTHDKLTVCGVEQLEHVSFEALPSVSEEFEFLGLTHEIVYLPSLPLRSQLSERGLGESSYALLGGAREMNLREDWAQGFAQFYETSRVFEGAESDPRTLGNVSASVLQVFGHGVQRFQREMITSIALDGGDLTFEAITELERAPLLGVLTACRGWTGPSRAGDGGAGNLAAAFLQRGTPTVVVSDADVSIAGSYAWSEAFHRALVNGMSPGRAALEARRELLSAGDSSDPLCGFLIHVVGVGHDPLFAPSDRRHPKQAAPAKRGPASWRIYLAGAGLLLLVVYALRRSRLSSQ